MARNIPRTGLCNLICTEESCVDGASGECMCMPGVIYLPAPSYTTEAPKFIRPRTGPRPQSDFELMPWVAYREDRATPTAPPKTPPRPRKRQISRISPPAAQSARQAPPRQQAQPIQPPRKVQRQHLLHQHPMQQIQQHHHQYQHQHQQQHQQQQHQQHQHQHQHQQQPEPQRRQHQQEPDSFRGPDQIPPFQGFDPSAFELWDDEWSPMAMLPTSPPSLTWGMSPYASDSPPTDDPEIPEDMQVGMGMMAYPGEEYIGPPVFDDYDMNRYIQPETEVPSDRRSWCDFLSSPDDDVKEGTPRFFDDSHVADICGDDGMGDDGFGLGGGGSAWRGMNLDFSGFLASGGTM